MIKWIKLKGTVEGWVQSNQWWDCDCDFKIVTPSGLCHIIVIAIRTSPTTCQALSMCSLTPTTQRQEPEAQRLNHLQGHTAEGTARISNLGLSATRTPTRSRLWCLYRKNFDHLNFYHVGTVLHFPTYNPRTPRDIRQKEQEKWVIDWEIQAIKKAD